MFGLTKKKEVKKSTMEAPKDKLKTSVLDFGARGKLNAKAGDAKRKDYFKMSALFASSVAGAGGATCGKMTTVNMRSDTDYLKKIVASLRATIKQEPLRVQSSAVCTTKETAKANIFTEADLEKYIALEAKLGFAMINTLPQLCKLNVKDSELSKAELIKADALPAMAPKPKPSYENTQYELQWVHSKAK